MTSAECQRQVECNAHAESHPQVENAGWPPQFERPAINDTRRCEMTFGHHTVQEEAGRLQEEEAGRLHERFGFGLPWAMRRLRPGRLAVGGNRAVSTDGSDVVPWLNFGTQGCVEENKTTDASRRHSNSKWFAIRSAFRMQAAINLLNVAT